MTNEEALKLIPFVRHSYNTKNFTKDSYTAGQWFGIVENALKQKAERRGKKKVYYHGENTFSYVCDQCAMPIDGKDAFCRWCGAKMEATE